MARTYHPPQSKDDKLTNSHALENLAWFFAGCSVYAPDWRWIGATVLVGIFAWAVRR